MEVALRSSRTRTTVPSRISRTIGSSASECLCAALLEAGFLWSRRGFDVLETLGYNLSLAILDVAYPPAWQVLAFGLLVTMGAAGREALRLKAARLEARQAN
jgi:hypothetical protein